MGGYSSCRVSGGSGGGGVGGNGSGGSKFVRELVGVLLQLWWWL